MKRKSTAGRGGNGSTGDGAHTGAEDLVEYPEGKAFPGVIARTADESSPAWPQPNRAKAGAPNVLFIVLDDTGFGHLGCYGGLAHTPHIDRLAAGGLLYSNMHTTALCSPTRSCILTGRNHHSNSMAGITEISTGFPGYDGIIPFENGFLSEILREKGYATMAVGKWHLTPAEQISAAGPYDRWPLGRGFDRYYGFLGGDTHQYYPELVHDNHQVAPPKTPEQGYHLTEDLVEKAIQFIGDVHVVAPDKPFFMYFCTGAMHAPHHVPKEWADKYKGKFDMGWDKAREVVYRRQVELGVIPPGTELSRQDPDVQRWDSLGADEKRLYARMMEVYAGFLEHTDHHIGRLIEALESAGKLDNTLIMLISDNGASAEGGKTGSVNENRFFNFVPESLADNLKAIDELGGPKYFNHYPQGWAHAGNTPFRRWKRETYRGGVSDPFIVHWPAGIRARGEKRTQYAHAIDMLPTVLEAVGIDAPAEIRGRTQSPIEGISLAYSFEDAEAASEHRTQYFEMLGHRSIYHDGWRAVCPWPGTSFIESGRDFGTPLTADDLKKLDAEGWELYHVEEDFSETKNVAKQHRDKLIELITIWYSEAGKYKVLPLDGRGQQRLAEARPQLTRDRRQYAFIPGLQGVPEGAAPKVLNKPHSITADVEIPKGGAEGVLACQGSNQGGYALYVKNKKLCYVYNYVGAQIFTVTSNVEVPEGRCELRFEFEVTGKASPLEGKGTPGLAQLYIDRKLVASQELPVTVPLLLGIGALFTCGRAGVSPVTDAYAGEFPFTGTIRKVLVDISGADLIKDDDKMLERMMMARQ
jgi:arylsulfatase A-like enzyme